MKVFGRRLSIPMTSIRAKECLLTMVCVIFNIFAVICEEDLQTCKLCHQESYRPKLVDLYIIDIADTCIKYHAIKTRESKIAYYGM